MIQFFRQNNFLTTLMLIPYTFIVRLASFYLQEKPVDVGAGGALYSVFSEAFDSHVILSHLMINFIIGFSAILVNRIVIKHRLTRFQTLLPGVLFILLVSWLEAFLSFSAIHIANFFILVAILSIFKFSKKKTSALVVFDGCFYVSLASLFYTPYIVFLIPAFLGFVILDSFGIRAFLNGVVGVFVPYFIVGGLMFFFTSDYHVSSGYELNLNIVNWFSKPELLDYIPLVVYGVFTIIAIISYPYLLAKTSLQVQKKLNILFWFFIASALSIFLIDEKNPAHLLILSLPLAILVGMVIERTKLIFIEEFVHLVILGGILFLHFNQSVNILM